MQLERVIESLGGVARWRDLVDAGFTQSMLVTAVRQGRVTRPHRGVYAIARTARADVVRTIFRAEPTCVTWCLSAGLPLETTPTTTHLAVPASRGLGLVRQRPSSEVTMHRCGVAGRAAAIHHLDVAASCTTPIQQVALLDAAIRHGLIPLRAVHGLVKGSQRRREWVLAHVSPSAESIGETYMRVALGEVGLHVLAQVSFEHVGRVDFLVEGVVVVEVDGFAYHSDQRTFARDRQRERSLAALGITTMRFTHAEVLADPLSCALQVVDVLWRQGAASAALLRTSEKATRRLGERPWWR